MKIDNPVVLPRPAIASAAAVARQRPLFTLVLATYGRSDVLGPMLDSLARQSWQGFELIVVDQNGDDRVVPMLEPIRQAGIVVSHLRASAPNLSAARNTGIDAAVGQWVAFPDDDCWYERDCLAQVAEAIGSAPQVDGWVVDWVEASGGIAATVPYLDASTFRAFRGGDASSITLFLKTATVRAVAGFDARIGVGRYYGAGEETDLMIRLLDHGATVHRLARARVHHHHSTERPDLSRSALRAVLRRERGVGALYSKHRLEARVIARGLLAPLVRGVTLRRPFHGLLFACATVAGRLDGMVRWRLGEPVQPPLARVTAAPSKQPPTGSPARRDADVLSEGVKRATSAADADPGQGERMSDESNRPEKEVQ